MKHVIIHNNLYRIKNKDFVELKQLYLDPIATERYIGGYIGAEHDEKIKTDMLEWSEKENILIKKIKENYIPTDLLEIII